jgi:hypothetical protein
MIMGNRLIISERDYTDIERHLLQSEDEQVAFVFAQVEATSQDVTLRADEHYLVPAEELEIQLPYHVSLTDEAQGRVIKKAWDRGAALVELHSHTNPKYEAAFSRSDLAGFGEFVPHVWWRLKGKPYLAVVVAPSGFDALVWRLGPDTAEGLGAMEIGGELRRPTNRTLAARRLDHVG